MNANIIRSVVSLLLLIAATPQALSATDRVVLTTSDQFTDLVAQCGRVVVTAYRRIGLDACLNRLPTERSLRTANHGLATGEMARSKGMEDIYPNLVRVPIPACRTQIVALTKGETIEVKGIESLATHRIGRVIGLKEVERKLANFDTYAVVTNESLMKMLDYGRIDVAVTERHIARQTIEDLGLSGIREADSPLWGVELFTYVHKDCTDLVPGLTSALSAMTEDGTMARLGERVEDPQTVVQGLVCEEP